MTYIYITIYLLLWKWRFLIRGATSISSCISSIMDSNSARIFAVFGSVWYFSEQFLLSHSTSPLAQTTYHQNWYKSIQDINAGLYHLSHFTRNIPHDTLFQGDCFPHAGNCEEGSGKQGLLVQEYMYLHIVLSLSLSLSLYIETRYSIQYMCIWHNQHLGPFTACWWATGVGKLCILRGISPRGDHGHVVVARVTADGEHLGASEPCNPSRFCGPCFDQPLQSVAFHFHIRSQWLPTFVSSRLCKQQSLSKSKLCLWSATMSPLAAVSALGS